MGQEQGLYSGLIRLHILHHAAQEGIFGLGIMAELARHGYQLSPGTLYPMLHSLERKGYLRSTAKRDGGHIRRVYCATPRGRRILQAARRKVRALFEEIFAEG
jgi:DNA-binding PadR family transcriptional regulator